jgi:molecular chaperone GrpE
MKDPVEKDVKKTPKSMKKSKKVDAAMQELTADLQRVQAEFINYKQRTQEEKQQLSQFSKSQVIKDLLPVIDDLERALGHTPEDLQENKWAQGVQKVYTRLQTQLQKLGVTKIKALNQPFDPEFHEAVQVEGDGDAQTVSDVLQNGYMLDSLIIRHATVKVRNS